MKVLYDASPLLRRYHGAKYYHHTLLSHLLPIARPHRLKLFPRLAKLRGNHHDRSNYPFLDTAVRLGRIFVSYQLHLPLSGFEIEGADLFHVTPQPYRLPESLNLTSFLHDPAPALMPSFHASREVENFQAFLRGTLPRLKLLAVPSEAVSSDLVRRFRMREERIRIIYHGVEEQFFHAPAAACYLLRETYDLPQRYILFLGSIQPRKNLRTLVRAFSVLRRELKRSNPLVIAGIDGWRGREIRRALKGEEHVRVIGWVRPALLPALYHSASLFVMPSLYEGFCLPLLEAMAACLPIVASNWSAIPEVVGEAGLLVDPHSPSELANAMERVLDTPRLAGALAESGRQRARLFRWETTAQQTKAFFEEAMGMQ